MHYLNETVSVINWNEIFSEGPTLWITLTMGGSHPQLAEDPLMDKVPSMSTSADRCIVFDNFASWKAISEI